MRTVRKLVAAVCILLIVVSVATTTGAVDFAGVLVPLEPLFGLIIVAHTIVSAADEALPPLVALAVRSPRAPPVS